MRQLLLTGLLTVWVPAFALAQVGTAVNREDESQRVQPRAKGQDRREYKRVPISYAAAVDRASNAVHSGELVEVEGVANVASDAFFSDKTKFFVQDGSGGVAVFGRRLPDPIVPGDLLLVRGRIKTYAGTSELSLHTFERLRRGAPPAAVTVTPADLVSRRYAGRLVKVRAGLIEIYDRPNSVNMTLAAGEGLLNAYLTGHQKKHVPVTALKRGATVEITGIGSAFARASGELRWQILPRTSSDIRIVKAAPFFTRRELMTATYVVGGLLAFAGLWIALLRAQVRRKTDAYRQVADRLRLLGHTVESTRDLITVTDLNERFTFVNSAFLHAYGYNRDDVLGKHVSLLDSPRNPPAVRSEISAAVSTTGWRGELFNTRADGSAFPISLSTSIVSNEEGKTIGYVGVARDITEERQVRQQLLLSEQRYRLLFDRSPLPTWLYESESGHILAVNEAAVRKYGFSRDEFLQMTISDIAVDAPSPIGIPQRVKGERLEMGIHRRANGEPIYVELTEDALEVEGREVRLLVANDVTEKKLAQEHVEYQAFHDGLTGLPNRRLFHDRLSMQLSQARRSDSAPIVMFVDLDRFKRINDTLGHWVGDELLKQAGHRLQQSVRMSDTIARVGGDEFTILLAQEEQPSPEAVAALSSKILGEFSRPFVVDERKLWVTASIGVSVYPRDGLDADTLLKSADFAMYRAKDLGRNNYQLSSGTVNSRHAADGLSLEHDLHHAMDRNELHLVYQPQVDVPTGRVIGVEALLRWEHPSRGPLLPRDFIGLAEESLLVVPIGEWIVRTACAQLAEWNSRGFSLSLAVNLSARQFQHGSIFSVVVDAVKATGIDPGALELEITERVAMQDVEKSSEMLRTMKRLGVKIAMDDFGTGYSSLGYLKYFPIDTVKVDQTFVRDITVDASDAAIVAAVIAMAHSLKLRVVAEGVETPEQLRFLAEHRCDAFQGFLFSPPVSAEQVIPLATQSFAPYQA